MNYSDVTNLNELNNKLFQLRTINVFFALRITHWVKSCDQRGDYRASWFKLNSTSQKSAGLKAIDELHPRTQLLATISQRVAYDPCQQVKETQNLLSPKHTTTKLPHYFPCTTSTTVPTRPPEKTGSLGIWSPLLVSCCLCHCLSCVNNR